MAKAWKENFVYFRIFRKLAVTSKLYASYNIHGNGIKRQNRPGTKQ